MQMERPFPSVDLPAGARAVVPALRRNWPHLALGGIAVLAAVLDFWNLSVNGLGNSYYAQAGYCFKGKRAISRFGKVGCIYDNEADVPLSASDRARINDIVKLEAQLGCRN